MSVRRRQNWLSQQRIDVPHMLSIESAMSNDFDELVNAFCVGAAQSYVLRGLELSMVGAVGGSANSLQMIVSDSAIFHGASATSGTFFTIASGTANQTLNATTNTKVNGSFTAGSLNYVGIDFSRTADSTTASQLYFWDATNDTEFTKNLPLALTLDYKIVITAAAWASTTLPIATIRTDASNNVTEVSDYRPMLFRLGTAGTSTPNPYYVYPWTHHAEGRVENFWQSTSATSPFRGGDKQLKTDKEWKDAVMSMILEMKGTTYWYSPNAGGSIIKLRLDLANMIVSGTGNITHSLATAGRINWSSDIFLNLIGSRLSYKISSNAATTHITLSDNQVAYITLIRGVNVAPNLVFTTGSPTVTSVGAVAWTTTLVSGDFIKVASQDDMYYYKISTVDSPSQVTLSTNFAEASTGASGVQAKYAYGVYSTNAAPSTTRHVYVVDREDVPFNEDVYWLMFRADNGGAVPTVFLRFPGGELRQGESMRINDDISEAILTYTGMTSEADGSPAYVNNNYVTDGYSLVTSISDLDGTLMRNTHQDRNAKLILGGSWTWTQATQLLSCTDWAFVQIPGLANEVNRITAASIAASGAIANDSCLYVSLNRSGGGGVLAIVNDTVTGIVDHKDKFIIARRSDSRVRSSTSCDLTVGNFGSGKKFKVLPKGGVVNEFTAPAGINTQALLLAAFALAGNWSGGVPANMTFACDGTDATTELTITTTTSYDFIDDGGGNPFLTLVNISNCYLVGTRVYVGDQIVLQDLETRKLTYDKVNEENENINFAIVKGNEWSWTLATTTLAWSSDFFIQVPGLADAVNQVSTGNTVLLDADGKILYVDINRSGDAAVLADLTLVASTVEAYVPKQNRIVIARRVGNAVIVANSIVLNDGDSFVLYSGSGGSASTLKVTQALHGFSVGEVVYYTGALWAWADCSALGQEGIGIISKIVDAGNFVITFNGYISGLAGLVAGSYYYVDVVASVGVLSLINRQYSAPIAMAISATELIMIPWKPEIYHTFGNACKNDPGQNMKVENGITNMIPILNSAITITVNAGATLMTHTAVGVTVVGPGDWIGF